MNGETNCSFDDKTPNDSFRKAFETNSFDEPKRQPKCESPDETFGNSHRRGVVGIATFHWGTNFGAALQGFALQTALSRLGFDSEFIDYCFVDERKKTARDLWNDLTRKNLWNAFLERGKNRLAFFYRRDFRELFAEKNRKFRFFWNSVCRRSLKYSTYRALASADLPYVACVAGSDQIWNPNSQKHPFYLLDFVPPEKRVAFAPSFAVSTLRKDEREHYRVGLSNFAFLSVRERDGKELAEALLNGRRSVERVLDPTFLLSADEWSATVDKYLEKSTASEEPFVLCYALGRPNRCLQVARKLKVKKIVAIGASPSNVFADWRGAVPIWNVGPFEFLDLFRNACAVVTDSFHGTAFSLIFRKNFWVVDRDDSKKTTSMNSRLTNLLDLFELQTRRVVASKEPFDAAEKIDFCRVDEILEREKKRSGDFLRRALEGTTGTR